MRSFETVYVSDFGTKRLVDMTQEELIAIIEEMLSAERAEQKRTREVLDWFLGGE